MSHIKTISILILSINLATAQSYAQSSARDCFQQTMKEEGIANMQNRFNPNTIAGKAECTPEKCPGTGEIQNTEIEV